MTFSAQDTLLYRRDEIAGGKLLSPEERVRMIKPYLPVQPTSQSSRPEYTNPRSASRFGVRAFLKNQLHLLVFTVIHLLFSIYIRIRQSYHAIRGRLLSIFFYHHRAPAMIRRDVDQLGKRPKHLAVVLRMEEDSRGGGELEHLVNQVSEVSAWCASAGVPVLTIYEATGILKRYLPQTHQAISQNLKAYFGRPQPRLILRAPHMPPIESPDLLISDSSDVQEGPGHLLVSLISREDGRESLVDLTKTLAEMAQRAKISPADVSADLLDAELTESVIGEPDLLILFTPHVELSGFPPWQLRLTEIYHAQDNENVGYQVFYGGLCKYANAQFRWGS